MGVSAQPETHRRRATGSPRCGRCSGVEFCPAGYPGVARQHTPFGLSRPCFLIAMTCREQRMLARAPGLLRERRLSQRWST
jgi:hypothetical protein